MNNSTAAVSRARSRRRALSQATQYALDALEQRLFLAADPIGGEFRVNTYTLGGQGGPAVASAANGDSVVVWQSFFQDGSHGGIYAQRFSASGQPEGPEFRVNSYTTRNQQDPAVAMDADGDFVVCWTSEGQDAGTYGVYAQRYAAGGAPDGPQFRVNTYTTSQQHQPAVAADASGNFVIAWTSFGQDGDQSGVFAQRFNAVGAPQGGEFKANSYTLGGQGGPAVAVAADGNFAIVWGSGDQDGDRGGIYGQRYSPSGVPLGGEFRVNTHTLNSQSLQTIGMSATGDFVCTWVSYLQDGSSASVYAQRYDRSGSAVGAEFRVNTFATGIQWYPYVGVERDGDFLISWASNAQDGDSFGVFAQRYDGGGVPQGAEFQVNTFTGGSQEAIALSVDGDGDAFVVWRSPQDGSEDGVYAQRYRGRYITVVPVDASGNAVPNNVPVPEGGVARFRISRSDVLSGQPRSVQIAPGGNVTPDDYASGVFTQPVVIPAGVESVIVSIPITADGQVEESGLNHETLTITATPLDAGFVVKDGTPNSVTFHVMDLDGTVVGLRADERDGSAVESAVVPDSASFRLRRTGDVRLPLTVDLDVTGTSLLNTATTGLPNGDYTVHVPPSQGNFTRSGSLYQFAFAADVQAMDIEVRPVNDTAVEGIEWVHAEVVPNPAVYRVTGNPEWVQTRVGIIDDEVDSIRVDGIDVSMAEAGLNEGRVEFTRRAIGTTTSALNVNFELRGTASASDVDVLLADGTLVSPVSGLFTVLMPAGVDTVAVRLRPRQDALPERDEVVRVELVAGSNYVGHPALNQVELRLTDNDRPTVAIVANDNSARESSSDDGRFTLSRFGGDLSQPLTVHLQVDRASTAGYGVDYNPFTLEQPIAAGQTLATIDIDALADRRDGEPVETLTLRLLPQNAYEVQASSDIATVQILERSPTGTFASFDWSMPKRYGIDTNNNGRTDLFNSAAYARPFALQNNGEPLFGVQFDASGSTGVANTEWMLYDRNGNRVDWPIASGSNLLRVPTVSAPTFRAELAEDLYTVQLTVTDGAGFSTTDRQLVEVSDIVIVSLGDSFAAGEGAPDVSRSNAIGALSGFPLSLPRADWADGGDDPEYVNPNSMDSQNRAGHRSTRSAASLTALALENADPKSSVTFIHLAQTGAEVTDGVILPKSDGAEGAPGYQLSQVDQAKQIIGDRPIDTMLMSVGGNDVGFSPVIESYMMRLKVNRWLLSDYHLGPDLQDVSAATQTGLARLPGRYQLLADRLSTVFASNFQERKNVLLTGYPDPTGGDDGQPAELLSDFTANMLAAGVQHVATAVFTGFDLLTLGLFSGFVGRPDLRLRVDVEESSHARTNAVVPINNAVRAAAAAHGWTLVPAPATFATHGYGSSDPWIQSAIGSRIMQGGDPYNPRGAVHPNYEGYTKIADGIRERTLLGRARPVATLPDTVQVTEGGSVTLDAGALESGWTAQWDLNYNGSAFNPTVDGNSALLLGTALTYPAHGRVALRVSDQLGRSSFAFADVQVLDGTSGRVVNEVPNVNVGEPFRLNLTRFRGVDRVNHWRVDWGDGTTELIPGDWDSRQRTFDTPGVKNIEVWLTDSGGEVPAGNATVEVIQDDPFPTVSIAAVDGSASEAGNDRGLFRITRTGSTALPLHLSMSILGSATNGVDYVNAAGVPFPLSLTIPFGQTTVDLELVPRPDNVTGEGLEDVTFRLNPSSLYAVNAAASQADISIADGPSTDLGGVAGKVFDDADGSGTQNAGEPNLAGWTVGLDANGNGQLDPGERTAVTDSQGEYLMAHVPAGSYALIVQVQSGWVTTAPVVRQVQVSLATTLANQDFSVARPVQISGRVFADANINGTLDAGEQAQPNIQVFVDYNVNGQFDAGEPLALTDAQGLYTAGGAKPGQLHVRPVSLTGWTSTNAGDGGARVVGAVGGQSIGNVHFGQRRVGPAIGSLTADPGMIASNTNANLAANNVDAAAAIVRFYRESNGEPGLQVGAAGDILLGADTGDAEGWRLEPRLGLPAGSYALYAQAEDAQGRAGNPTQASVTVNGAPGSSIIGISTRRAFAREGNLAGGEFLVTRSGSNAGPVTVQLGFPTGSGFAIRGTDYIDLGSTVTIPASEDGVRFYVVALADGAAEPLERVQVNVLASAGYVVGPAASASLFVMDDGPQVRALSPEFGRLQRPHSVSVAFSDDVSASLGVDDFVVTSLTTGQNLPPEMIALDYDLQADRAEATFTGANNSGLSGVLPDGRYRATVLPGGVTDHSGRPLNGSYSLDFTFMLGDANGDGRVNLQDFNILATNFGQSNRDFSQGDFNYDGSVDLRDFNLLASRFGQAVGPDGSINSTGGQPPPTWPGSSSSGDRRVGLGGGGGTLDTDSEDEWVGLA